MILSRKVHIIIGQGLFVCFFLKPLIFGSSKQIKGVPPNLTLRHRIWIPTSWTYSSTSAAPSPSTTAISGPIPNRTICILVTIYASKPGTYMIKAYLLDERCTIPTATYCIYDISVINAKNKIYYLLFNLVDNFYGRAYLL